MSVTEQGRKDWFEEHMGTERAATMMSLLPSAGWADVATKRDLDGLEERLNARLHELRSDLQRTFATWMFAAQGAVVAAIGLLFALLR